MSYVAGEPPMKTATIAQMVVTLNSRVNRL